MEAAKVERVGSHPRESLNCKSRIAAATVYRRCLARVNAALIFDDANGLMGNMQADLERILFDEATIHRRLDELAQRITSDYQDRELTVVAILNGSLILMADLLRRIPLPLKLDCLSVASYHGDTKSVGELVFRHFPLPDIAGRHVLILDDILDSGVTLATTREKLETAGPLSIRICVLLAKKRTRVRAVEVDYVGFEIADEFVVGYGLDYREGYRNLPCIGVLRKELIATA
jgi:hypoxanthine phosphoribosyltransferase